MIHDSKTTRAIYEETVYHDNIESKANLMRDLALLLVANPKSKNMLRIKGGLRRTEISIELWGLKQRPVDEVIVVTRVKFGHDGFPLVALANVKLKTLKETSYCVVSFERTLVDETQLFITNPNPDTINFGTIEPGTLTIIRWGTALVGIDPNDHLVNLGHTMEHQQSPKVGEEWHVKNPGATCLVTKWVVEVSDKTIVVSDREFATTLHPGTRYLKDDLQMVEHTGRTRSEEKV